MERERQRKNEQRGICYIPRSPIFSMERERQRKNEQQIMGSFTNHFFTIFRSQDVGFPSSIQLID
jgi:hypothetical protein